MKKFIMVMLLVVTFGFFGIRAFADEAETGNLVIHFKAWNEDYTELGSWAWGGPAEGKVYDGLDDFGAYWEYNDIPVGTEVGFIAVLWPGGAGPDWGNKLTEDVLIPEEAIVAGETVHVYVFEGANSKEKEGDPQVFYSKPDKVNFLVIYFDPTGSYEEKIGVHAWGWDDVAPGWADPYPIGNAGKVASGYRVKGIMLHADDANGGLLVYAGGDENKKTGDVNLSGLEVEKGEVGIKYVVSKGNAYTVGDNIYTDYAEFAVEAFTFKLIPFDVDEMDGTYAVDPHTIIVKTSAQVASPYPEATDKAAALEEIEGWFSVKDSAGKALEIERIDFATSNPTLGAFVVVLKDALDNTKEYTLYFDAGEDLEAEIEIAMDTDKPVIQFISPTNIVGKEAGQRIIEIEWGKPFDQNLFPRFRATDDRDGDLTPFIYVPKGQYSVLDTRTEGDYVIMLEVKDTWGNVAQETFIFRVIKK